PKEGAALCLGRGESPTLPLERGCKELVACYRRALMTDTFTFTVAKTHGAARTGEIRMPRGVIRTPAFMPVGTAATVTAMSPDPVKALGADVVLANTYHLMLRPGAERVARLGGLHKFMNWP